MIAMQVFADREDRRRFVRRAGDNDGYLFFEIDHLLENADRVATLRPDSLEICSGIDALLAFAVVTKGRALQDRRPSDLPTAFVRPARSATLKWRHRKTGGGKEFFLPKPILRDQQDLTSWPNDPIERSPADRVGAGMFSNSEG